MKFSVFAILALAPLCAQQPSPVVQVAPGTPAVKPPQASDAPAVPAADIKPDTVVIEAANGKKYTAAEVEHLMLLLPPQYQQQARSQPEAAAKILTQVLFLQGLAEQAEKEGIDQRAPYKEQIEAFRTQTLAQAEMMLHHNVPVGGEEQEKYYKDHPDKFQEAAVSVILVSFNPNAAKAVPGGKKLLTEDEAKAKIEDLRKQIVGGVDFGKLARENSDDPSAAKDGAFGTIKRSSPYPDVIKNAVFALKAGEMSQVIRQPSGLWLIRLDKIQTLPYDQVTDQVNAELQQEKFQAWQNSILSQYTVKVDNPAYFAPKPAPAQLQQVH